MRQLTGLAFVLLISACAPDAAPPASTKDVQETAPESLGDLSWTKGGMVAAANPYAVEAGLEILREGGNAIDAAIAVHTVLGLVEPESSGIGGGAFLVYYDRARDTVTVFDGRETAPAEASPELFFKDGKVMDFVTAWQSGRSVGVPGQIALYKAAHDASGRADWKTLFEPAIRLAEDGFKVSPKLAEILASPRLRGAIRLDDNPVTAAYFYPDGEPLTAGFVRTNPAYAATLAAVAEEGPAAFYSGRIADEIIAAVTEGPDGGAMTLDDLKAYTVAVREPVCGELQSGFKICSAPPPSSGGIAQNLIMGLYDHLKPAASVNADESLYLKAFVDAQRLAYADRDHYVADADFVSVPTAELIDPAYIKARALEVFAPDAKSFPGDPGLVLGKDALRPMWGEDTTTPGAGTTHISIIDLEGNAVAMTATIEAAFGSSRMAGGFLLNNELTDFALTPTKGGKPVANAPAPGKRPRSSMSPTLVFDKGGDLFMVTGSPGGNSIVAYVAKTLVGVLEWNKTAQEAAALPNIIARGDTVAVEVDVAGGAEAAAALREMGYTVEERTGENSGLHLIVVRERGLEGGADPRREGVATPIR
ncbi:gamma-glutamyltransferase [Hyphomonas sp.]|jgi:gamma-glutamyltranspeptidase/glutathione hydrolase|uniref:gamma-glutamyltransferase n=1 Tax=Hyphomonas sp. TaxID=87 RepID=UPI0037BF8676